MTKAPKKEYKEPKYQYIFTCYECYLVYGRAGNKICPMCGVKSPKTPTRLT
jgi:rRNA maturation endonuclease Nob1